ncbi:monovalent cation/H(+) antiporter subunit G [Actinomadura terrae]|uniref:monovalent cation/H(+) antiporter subunit G n=1 Tax=Actinomadura terrae TaxID=604353 RepID=UPI001FA736E4|nr:monovalent cation/H(+) antiporter subunit G [Actinomadura terrae]
MTALSYVLVWAGVAVVGGAALAVPLPRGVFTRLHLVGVGTTLGVPPLIAGLAVAPGIWSSYHDVLKLVLIGVLVFASGPATVVATARAAYKPIEEKAGRHG